MNHCIYVGKNIKQSTTDVLMQTTLQELTSIISNNEDIAYDCKRLRNVLRLDRKAYHKAKTCLPYFTIGEFINGIRNGNNFINAKYLVIDLDNCAASITQCNTLKAKLVQENNTILFAFVSPSGTGIKLLFGINTPIQNMQQYTLFYRHFVYNFCKQNQLEQFVDYKNCDVTRVCFLANDKEVYYNPNAIYINFEPTSQTETIDVDKEENNYKELPTAPVIAEDVYKEVLKALNADKAKATKTKQVFVPEALKQVDSIVYEAIAPYNFEISEKKAINYGMQFTITHGINKAVINLFYGKRGFSVFAVPRCDVNASMNDLVHKLISVQLFEIEKSVKELIYSSFINDKKN